ncbi:hypothetical protein [Legionella fairfieldensis]|uniref:hypothetical protein n=1 Tax=Legionella fairfieldensis TaxID=45064 RepID=UPI00048B581C|nr:hypothetical protein [Legionella fairfieldensis]
MLITLNMIAQSHKKLKNSFFPGLYGYKREENHWEKIVRCIEQLIDTYKVKDFELKWSELKAALSVAKNANLIRHEYHLNLESWEKELNKVIASTDQFETEQDFLPLINELIEQYQNYQGKQPGFIEEVNQKRIDKQIEKQKREQEIAILKKRSPQETSIPNIDHVLPLILQYIDEAKDLCNLELVSYFVLGTIEKLKLWEKLITTHNNAVILENIEMAEEANFSQFEFVSAELSCLEQKKLWENAITALNKNRGVNEPTANLLFDTLSAEEKEDMYLAISSNLEEKLIITKDNPKTAYRLFMSPKREVPKVSIYKYDPLSFLSSS